MQDLIKFTVDTKENEYINKLNNNIYILHKCDLSQRWCKIETNFQFINCSLWHITHFQISYDTLRC